MPLIEIESRVTLCESNLQCDVKYQIDGDAVMRDPRHYCPQLVVGCLHAWCCFGESDNTH